MVRFPTFGKKGWRRYPLRSAATEFGLVPKPVLRMNIVTVTSSSKTAVPLAELESSAQLPTWVRLSPAIPRPLSTCRLG